MTARSRIRVTSRVPVHVAWIAPLMVVALVAAAQLLGPAEPDPTPARAVVLDRATYACPLGDGRTVAAGQVRAGREAAARTLPGGEAIDALQDASRWRTAAPGGRSAVVAQEGRGTGAVGFVSGTAPSGAGGGLVVASCPEGRASSWFLGAGSGAGHESTVVLTNLGDTPAVADLALWGPRGRVDAVNGEGVVVDPGQVRRVRLADLAAGEADLAVRVERRRGSLATTIEDTSTGASRWTQVGGGTLSPRRDQVLPATSGTSRTLELLNPGRDVARVSVRALGADGRFSPEGLSSLRVRPGRTASIDVPTSVGRDAVAFRLVSTLPVAASVRSATADDADTVVASRALTGPSVLPIALDERRVPDLLLTETAARSTTARVEAYSSSGTRVDSARVRVAGQSSVTVDLARELELDDVAYLVVRPSGGALVGTAAYRDGARVALPVLRTAPVEGAGPQVGSRY